MRTARCALPRCSAACMRSFTSFSALATGAMSVEVSAIVAAKRRTTRQGTEMCWWTSKLAVLIPSVFPQAGVSRLSLYRLVFNVQRQLQQLARCSQHALSRRRKNMCFVQHDACSVETTLAANVRRMLSLTANGAATLRATCPVRSVNR